MKTKLRKKATGCTSRFFAVFSHITSATNIIIFFLIVLMMCYGCSKSTSPNEKSMITIEILQNGSIQETFIVTEENDGDVYPVYDSKTQIGEIEIDYVEFILQPCVDPHKYFFIVARKNQSYSLFNSVEPFDTLRFDYQLDFDAVNDSLNCGTMYQRGFGYVHDAHFSVWKDSVFVDSLFTDSLGRFETTLEPDSFSLRTSWPDVPEIEFILIEGYGDYFIQFYYIYVDKPNIYLYPENPIELDVSILFPQTGRWF